MNYFDDIFHGLHNWREERGLDKLGYIHKAEVAKDIEETFELIGYDNQQIPYLVSEFMGKYYNNSISAPTKKECLDAHIDKIVFAINAIHSLGYNPERAITEVIKEISSRTGAYNEESGKWEKFKTPEAKALWYKADFKSCKL